MSETPRMIEAIVLSAVTSETKKSGEIRKVTFMLPNDGGDHPFRGCIGERIGLVCIKLAENEHETTATAAVEGEDTEGGPTTTVQRASPAPKRRWEQLSPTEQAGIRCADPEFQRWLCVADADLAAMVVRQKCGVDTRAGLNTNEEAAERWRRLNNAYLLRSDAA
jgi:hypothetical protein